MEKDQHAQAAKERISLHIAQTPLAFIEWDLNFRVSDWNKAAELLFGYSKEEAMGQHASFIVPEELWPHVDGIWEALMNQTGGSRSTNTNTRKDGKLIVGDWYNTTLRNIEEKAVGMASIIIDHTQISQTEEALQRERQFTEMALNTQLDTFFLFDPKIGKAIKWNRIFSELSGYSDEEISQMKAPESYYSETDLEKASAMIDQLNKGNESGTIVLDLICKNGETIPTEYVVSKVLDENGELLYLTSNGRDIRKRLEAAEKNKGFNRLLDSSLNEVYIFNATDYHFIEVNVGARKNLGYSIEEMHAMTPLDLKPEFSLQEFNNLVEPLRNGEKTVIKFYTKHKRKNGSLYPVEVYLQLMQIGQAVFVAMILDITERLEAEETIRSEQIRYEKLFNQIADPIVVFDQKNHHFLDCNLSAISRYGYSKEEFLKMTPFDLHPPEDLTRVSVNIDDKSSSAPNEYIHQTKGGELINVEIHTQELNYQNTEAWISIIRDITKRKEAESELREAKERAEESDRLKSAFLANMSHEIRTPMNAILGFTELLEDAEDTDVEMKARSIEVIKMSGNRLLNLINDLIDIAKIEANQIRLYNENIELNSLLEKLRTSFLPDYLTKALDLKFSPPEHKGVFSLITDENRLCQILTNLIRNAYKFTKTGGVEFGYNIRPKEVEFYVKDTGIGISPDIQEAIFDRFMQAEDLPRAEFDGTGLGLSISKALVEKMGGMIKVESTPGEGSLFTFTLPIKTESL